MYLAYNEQANELLARDPLALLIGMLLDQQIPMEKAFTSPDVLRERMGGSLDARAIADADPEALETIFRTPPALHRFPAAMAKRVQTLAQILVERYDGSAAAVWADVRTGDELVARIATLPGFGDQKARMFAALLGKQLDVRPRGWRKATGAYGEDGIHKSVADVVDEASLKKVRAYKQETKRAAKAAAEK